MKKILKFMILALVAMCGFASCSEECDHNFIEYDYNEALVGTWTSWEEDYAEAMVIEEDGSFTIIGIAGGAWHEDEGTLSVVNNKIALTFKSSGETLEGRLELVAGETMSIVLNEKFDIRATYHYCKNDLSDEIIGMWVSTDKVFGQEEESVAINTYTEDGKSYLTAYMSEINGYLNQMESEYKVIGNLLIGWTKATADSPAQYLALGLEIMPNGTELGDIMTHYNPIYKTTATFVRVKQNLNTGKIYDYSSAYVTNAKGTNEDFSIFGDTFNMTNIKASDFDMIFGSNLYCVELNANSIIHRSRPYGQDVEVVTPVTVEGNMVTLDFSAVYPACREVEMYMFQDADDSQLHIFMPTSAFINYFGNMEILTLLLEGKLDPTDPAAFEKVFADMEARIESINVSFVLKARK